MEFENNDLLNLAEIRRLIKSDFPNEKAELVVKKLINYCFIHKDQNLYILQKNVSYKKCNNDMIIKYVI